MSKLGEVIGTSGMITTEEHIHNNSKISDTIDDALSDDIKKRIVREPEKNK